MKLIYKQDNYEDESNLRVFRIYEIDNKTTIEILKYYDEDKQKYDDFYTIMQQYEYKKGCWDGMELNTFKSLNKAIRWVTK